MNKLPKDADLTKALLAETGTAVVTETPLVTNEKVLARITDGIYRAPGSSLRELLSNAYDADATEVVVNTDAPRFKRIVVRDNGRGMSLETLAHVVQNIGGSAKRTQLGQQLRVSDAADPTLSPGGRKLIGKIGIGLFSVAHLSHHFKIVTKAAGNRYRAHAEIILAQYRDDDATAPSGEYEQGIVRIWSEPDEEVDTQGTDITVLDLKPSAIAILRSREIWQQLNTEETKTSVEAPRYHIGELALPSGDTIQTTAAVPWSADATPEERFQALVDGVIAFAKERPSAPVDLEKLLDNYFNTLWTLGLALPLPPVHRSPLEFTEADDVGAYVLSNSVRGQAKKIALKKDGSIASAAGIEVRRYGTDFKVLVDGVRIARPIDVLALPATSNAIKRPQIFVGQYRPDLSKIPASYRGGELEISGYFAWAPKMVPSEHQGVLIRINGASGALFDNTFLRYKVAERTRLTQITAEVFVDLGLDSALNIDRESFNYTHPHYVILQNWVHSALRQIANELKDLAKEKRAERKAADEAIHQDALSAAVAEEWILAGREQDEDPPPVVIAKGELRARADSTAVRLDKDIVFDRVEERSTAQATKQNEAELTPLLEAIYKVLLAHGLFDKVSTERQTQVLAAIARLLDVRSSK